MKIKSMLQKKAVAALDEVNHIYQGNQVVLYFLSALVSQANVLLFSAPGKGKSHLSESAAEVLGVSYKRVQGSPGLMESHFNAKFNVGKLMQGIEEVEWRDFLSAKIKLFDELSRVPPQTLAALHTILAEKTAYFGNESLKLEPSAFIASMNPLDSGSFELYAALLDRFDISINIPTPRFKDKSLIYEGQTYKPKSVLAEGELEQIWKEVAEMPVSAPVKGSAFVITRELQLCAYGDKEFLTNFPAVCKDCRFRNNVCSRVKNAPSERTYLSALRIAKGLAYLKGKSAVTTEEVIEVMPAVLTHRLQLVPEIYRQSPTKLHAIELILHDILSKESERKAAYTLLINYAEAKDPKRRTHLGEQIANYAQNDLLVEENFKDLQSSLEEHNSDVSTVKQPVKAAEMAAV